MCQLPFLILMILVAFRMNDFTKREDCSFLIVMYLVPVSRDLVDMVIMLWQRETGDLYMYTNLWVSYL